MKKLSAILLAAFTAVVLSACSAADDSTITSPRMGDNPNNSCSSPTILLTTSSYILVQCEDGSTLKCVEDECKAY